MSDTAATTDTATTPPENGADQQRTFTQDEVNELVGKARTEERRKVQSKFADYDDLKAKAEKGQTAEERIAELENKYAQAETARLRSDIAARFGVSAEDRDLFLTGTDEDTLTAQAKRLTEREADRKKQGNVAPKEGGNQTPGAGDSDVRGFANALFDRALSQ